MFTLKKLLLNNLITLNKSLTLEIYEKQKNQRLSIGFTGILANIQKYYNVINLINYFNKVSNFSCNSAEDGLSASESTIFPFGSININLGIPVTP